MKKQHHSGFTLIELMVAVFLGALLVVSICTVFIQISRFSKSTTVQLLMSARSFQMVEKIERDIRRACHIAVSADGTELALTMASDEDGDFSYDYSTVYYRYDSGDDNHETIGNNRLVYDVDNDTSNNNETLVLRYIAPSPDSSGGYYPIFSEETSLGSTVYMEFRLGDLSESPPGSQNAITGPGYQGVYVHTHAAPRNTRISP